MMGGGAAAGGREPRLVPDWLARRARTHGAHPAVEAPSGTLAYGELEARVAAAARTLSGEGTEPVAGAPVAVLAANDLPLCILSHAVPRAGAVLMPINARLTPGEIAWQLLDSGTPLLLADGEHRGLAEAALAEMAEPPPGGRPPPAPTVRAAEELAEPAGANGAPGPEPALDLDAVHSALYTSGTSGRPKAALLTHGNLLASAAASAFHVGVRAEDRWLAPLPLYHVGGLSVLIRSTLAGTTAVVHRRFDEGAVSRALREEGVTLASLVPAMLGRLLDHDEGRPPYPSAVRAVLVGGAGAPAGLLARAEERGLPVAPTYGLTEAASQVTTLAPGQARRRPAPRGSPSRASPSPSMRAGGGRSPARSARSWSRARRSRPAT